MCKILIISIFIFVLSFACSKDDNLEFVVAQTEELTDGIQDSTELSDLDIQFDHYI